LKIKLDENLPTSLAGDLSKLGHDVDTVFDEGLAGQSDRVFITQDLDFSDIRQYQAGSHPGLLIVWLLNPSRRALSARLYELIASEPVETWSRCFVVATDRKIRIHRPKK